MSTALPPSLTRYALAVLAATAALVAAGCGSSSSKSATATSAATGATATTTARVTSKDGRFDAVIPSGFKNAIADLQGEPVNVLYLAIGPRRQGFTTNINVVREPSRGVTDLDVIARDELNGLRRGGPAMRRLSPPQPVAVDGAPGRLIDYLRGGTPMTHERQLFALHGGWIYSVTYSALPSTYAASLPGLQQMLSSWSWR